MKTAIIALTASGLVLAGLLQKGLPEAVIYTTPRLFAAATTGNTAAVEDYRDHNREIPPLPEQDEKAKDAGLLSLGDDFGRAIGLLFSSFKALIFISAVAIAVRSVAPYLAGKGRDPAVVVIDESGCYAISLLSGHLGGANELTKKAAGLLKATAVITTATDLRQVTAFDSLAASQNWKIENLASIKRISSALLEEKEILFYSEKPLSFHLQGKIRSVSNKDSLREAQHGAVYLGSAEDLPLVPEELPLLILRPRHIFAGVGCRKGIAAARIEIALRAAFAEAKLSFASLGALASGTFKAAEPGLLEAAGTLSVPFITFSPEEINGAAIGRPGSDFVEKTVGVKAVAEPCALLAAGKEGRLVLERCSYSGITVALAAGPVCRLEQPD